MIRVDACFFYPSPLLCSFLPPTNTTTPAATVATTTTTTNNKKSSQKPTPTGVLQSRLRRSKASKLVVFFSNCDSVDFHHELFRRELQLSPAAGAGGAGGVDTEVKLLGDVPVLRLHGDMLQPERTSSLVTFAKVSHSHRVCVVCACKWSAWGLSPATSMLS